MSYTKTNQASDKIGILSPLSFIKEKHSIPQQSSAVRNSLVVRNPKKNKLSIETDDLRFYKFL